MIDLVANKRSELAEACHDFRVRRLDLFGSATRNDFDVSRSDLDFVADFADRAPTAAYARRVLEFSETLERILGHRVDVVISQSIRNPFFRRVIEATRQPVYEG